MQKYDVAIVGGGPVGGYVAKHIASEGFNVAVFEEHKHIGEPVKCAGLVTPRVFDVLGMSPKHIVQNKIKGAHIHSPSDHILTIGGDKVHALAIDRSRFDKEIINSSEDAGAKIFLANKITSAQRHEGCVSLTTSQNNDIICKLLIGADGPYSKIRDRFGLPQPKEMLQGIGAEITGVSLDPDFVEIFVGKDIAPGFFAWVVPTNAKGNEARAGLCVNHNAIHPPKYYFSHFLDHVHSSPYLGQAHIRTYIGGAVPLGPLKQTYGANLMLVGDAAAQVKPTSGGGIYTGLLCARHCSSVALGALEKNEFTQKALKKYHKLWSAEIGRELNLGMKFRALFTRLTDKQMDKYIQKFQNPEIIDIISTYGDIDYPSKLVKPLLKKTPSLLALVPKILKE